MTAQHSHNHRPRLDVGIVVISTEGSRWELWETEHRYRRAPRHEASREDPAWGGPDAGPLQDHVWHEFADWSVIDTAFGARLQLETGDRVIWAPEPFAPVGTRHTCTRCD